MEVSKMRQIARIACAGLGMVALSTPAFAQAAGAGGLNLIDIAQNMSGIAIAVAVVLFVMSFWSVGVAIELNADPKRLDLDWRYIPHARALGVPIEIGPDAHSPRGLDVMNTGIGIARKGGLTAGDVLNTRSADDVLAFARARRERGGR